MAIVRNKYMAKARLDLEKAKDEYGQPRKPTDQEVMGRARLLAQADGIPFPGS